MHFVIAMDNEIGFDTLVKKDAGIDDTLRLIISTINKYSSDPFVKQVVHNLGPVTDRNAFIHKLFDYYCRNVNYLLDNKGTEKVYTPSRIISEGTGDCKKAATFLASVLTSANIPAILKHVYYNNRDSYTHIYVIVPNPDTNHYITLDPTNGCNYDKEVDYKSATLYYLNGKKMDLRLMGKSNYDAPDGIAHCMGEMHTDLNGIGNYVTGAARINHTDIVKHLVPKDSKLQARLSKIPLNIQRASFLELVKHNVHGIASNLALMLSHKPMALNTLWAKIGGDINHVKEMILEGAKKQPDMHQATIGFSLAGMFTGAAGILHAIAPVASVIGADIGAPGLGADLEGMSRNASNIANAMPVVINHQLMPPPNIVHIRPGGFREERNMGSFGSIGGFMFKSLLILCYVPLFLHIHINSIAINIMVTLILCTPLFVYTYKKCWIKKSVA